MTHESFCHVDHEDQAGHTNVMKVFVTYYCVNITYAGIWSNGPVGQYGFLTGTILTSYHTHVSAVSTQISLFSFHFILF